MTRRVLNAVVALAVGSLPACNNPLTPSTHALVGNAYDPANGCLQPQQSFDIVDGPAPSGTCDVVCITDAKTGTVYVTNACGPYPTADTVDAGRDTCSLALAAWAAGNACGAASDAASDAGADAPGDAKGDGG